MSLLNKVLIIKRGDYMKTVKGLLWGAIIVILGVIWGINESGVANISVFFEGWWTLFIIIPSFIGLFTDKNKAGSLIGLAIGGVLLAGHYIDLSRYENFVFPAVVVFVGVVIIVKALTQKKSNINNDDSFNTQYVNQQNAQNALPNNENAEYYATFSGQNLIFNDDFVGASFISTFGGIKVDLRNARIVNNAVITANTTFGGIDILLPPNVNVVVKSNSIFGGVSDKTSKNLPPEVPTLFVNSQNLFGGTEIK